MDNILEWLVPLIFAGVYFFGNMLSSKSEEADSPTGSSGDAVRGDGEAAERQRRVQDEIRRKIIERRQAATGEGTARPQSVQGKALSERRKAVTTRLEQRRTVREQRKETHEAAVPLEPSHDIETDEAVGEFSWDESDNVCEQNMQAQLSQIEATKRRAAALRHESHSSTAVGPKRSAYKETPQLSRGGLLSGSVRNVLSNPAAARAAFVYGEVLGKPISLRKSENGLAGQS